MQKSVIISVAIVLVLSGCAGRKPNPVQEIQEGDAQLSCQGLRTEIEVNNAALLGLLKEKKKKQDDNVAAGVVGAVVFFPALFFMDLKGAAGEEARAYQRRNQGLLKRYEQKRCKPKIVIASPDDAEKKDEAQKKTASE